MNIFDGPLEFGSTVQKSRLSYIFLLAVEIGFNPAQYRVNERERLVTFEVENRNPDRAGEYMVQFTTVQGTATESTNGGQTYLYTHIKLNLMLQC